MATKDAFWTPFAPGSNIHIGHALGVLAQAAYVTTPPPVQAWAAIFDLPTYGVILTDDDVCPNVTYAGEPGRMVIAIPGTTTMPQMIDNILMSAQRENEPDFGYGRIHSFFAWCAESIIQETEQVMSSLPANTELCFIGHSLGGAVAQLLADYAAKKNFHRVKFCCTFNSPRVGDGDWARRSRPYSTHLYYGSHDMVCEMPPPLTASSTAWQTELAFLDNFEHRDTLIEIDSGFSLLPSWIAITEAKAAEGTRFAVQDLAGKALNSRYMRWLGRSAAVAGIVSWLQPLPAWYWSHSMRHLLDAFEETSTFRRYLEYDALFNLRAALDADPSTGFTPGIRIRGIVPPYQFRNFVIPPRGILALPPSPHGARVEVIESAFEEDGTPEIVGSETLVNAANNFADGLFGQAATSSSNPLAAAAPVQAGPPIRANWLFKGTDRRLLLWLVKALAALEERDYWAFAAGPTAALSTRETVFDDDAAEAAELVLQQLRHLLGLFYEPTP